MTITIRPATRSDVDALSGRLREADAQELLAAGNESVKSALAYSFEASTQCRTVEIDGLPVGLFGIVAATILGDEANIWFLGTPELARIKKTFVKESRRVVGSWLECYTVLWNVVDVRYSSAIRWLESMGAVFDDGSAIAGFRRFTITRGNDKAKIQRLLPKVVSSEPCQENKSISGLGANKQGALSQVAA